MTDPVAGSYTGLHATISFASSRDYVATKGGYTLEQTFESPWPTGDAMEHNVPTGFKLTTLYVERQMLDDTFIQKLLTTTPSAGTAKTVVTGGTSLNTDGVVALNGTAPVDSGDGLLKVTIAGATTTLATTLYATGYDVNGNLIYDAIYIPVGSLVASTFYSHKPFHTVKEIVNAEAAGTGVTCTVASVVGTTTYGAASGPGDLVNIEMKLLHPVTGKMVQATFSNCYVKTHPVETQGGKAVSGKIEFVMQNPNADMVFVSA
jgi:hypothetical protein